MAKGSPTRDGRRSLPRLGGPGQTARERIADLEIENRRLVRQRDYLRVLFQLGYRCPCAQEALGDGRLEEHISDGPDLP